MTKGTWDSLIIAVILSAISVGIWLTSPFQGRFWFGLTFTGGAAIFWIKWIWIEG